MTFTTNIEYPQQFVSDVHYYLDVDWGGGHQEWWPLYDATSETDALREYERVVDDAERAVLTGYNQELEPIFIKWSRNFGEHAGIWRVDAE